MYALSLHTVYCNIYVRHCNKNANFFVIKHFLSLTPSARWERAVNRKKVLIRPRARYISRATRLNHNRPGFSYEPYIRGIKEWCNFYQHIAQLTYLTVAQTSRFREKPFKMRIDYVALCLILLSIEYGLYWKLDRFTEYINFNRRYRNLTSSIEFAIAHGCAGVSRDKSTALRQTEYTRQSLSLCEPVLSQRTGWR